MTKLNSTMLSIKVYNPSKNDRSCADNPPVCFGFTGCNKAAFVTAEGMPKEEDESIGGVVETRVGGVGCSWFLKPSPFPGLLVTLEGTRKAPTEPIPMPPSILGGEGKTSKPSPKVSLSPSKSTLSSPTNDRGEVEDDGGGGIAFTPGSSTGEFGHNSPPRAAAWLTRACTRSCSASLTDGAENMLVMRLV